jgi:hypothetical protein
VPAHVGAQGGEQGLRAAEVIGEIALAIDMGADAVGIGKSIHFPSHRPQGLAPKKTIF